MAEVIRSVHTCSTARSARRERGRPARPAAGRGRRRGEVERSGWGGFRRCWFVGGLPDVVRSRRRDAGEVLPSDQRNGDQS